MSSMDSNEACNFVLLCVVPTSPWERNHPVLLSTIRNRHNTYTDLNGCIHCVQTGRTSNVVFCIVTAAPAPGILHQQTCYAQSISHTDLDGPEAAGSHLPPTHW